MTVQQIEVGVKQGDVITQYFYDTLNMLPNI